MVLDKEILASLGINLDDEKTEALIKMFEEQLQERVGAEIFEALDDDHAKELVTIQESGDESSIAAYIEQNIPDFRSIVEDETDILLGELADNAESFGE
jgi:hypothetical protein